MRKLREAHKLNTLLSQIKMVMVMSALMLTGMLTTAVVATRDSYQALLQERADLTAEARTAINAAREREDKQMTEEEEERNDEIDAKIESLNAAILLEDKQRDRERTVAGQPMEINHDVLGRTRPNTPSGGPFLSLGDQLQYIVAAENGNLQAREKLETVVEFHRQEFGAAGAGAESAIDSDGGFLIQTDTSSEIMRKMHDVGDLINRVRRIPLGTNSRGIKIPMIDESSRADGSRGGGFQGYWIEEGVAPTVSQAKLARLEMELHKVGALGYATDELLEDAPAMTAIFTQGFAEELLFKVEDAIFEGDGAGKPQGFTNANCLVTVAKETGQAADTVVHENLVNMWARGWGRSRSNMIWMINQDVEPALDALAKNIGTAGVEPNYVTYSLEGVMRIKGRPVVNSEYCSTLGDLDDIVLVDLSQYAFIDKGGIDQSQSIHVRFTTGEMTFRAFYRLDGGVLWKEALTPFKGGANTLSPFITLAARD